MVFVWQLSELANFEGSEKLVFIVMEAAERSQVMKFQIVLDCGRNQSEITPVYEQKHSRDYWSCLAGADKRGLAATVPEHRNAFLQAVTRRGHCSSDVSGMLLLCLQRAIQ